MSCEKDWVDISAALLTPVVAIIGIWIAIQQMKINKTRINHELFDRKYLMYEATQRFIDSVSQKLLIDPDDYHHFYVETKGALFIFNQEIVSYIDKVIDNAINFKEAIASKDDEMEREIVDWFEEQNLRVDEVFKKHISL